MALPTGALLGPYEIQALLGVGGMGEVYRAKDTRLDRTVAVKVLKAPVRGGSRRRDRFAQEARAVSRLSHPHICVLYDVGEQGGMPFLVMEHVQGRTLAERLEDEPLVLGEALQIGVEIAQALASAHSQGVVHRDLKPGNVMLTREGVKLLDFGVAKLCEAAEGSEDLFATSTGGLTDEGEILGTVPYMSPEQLEGREVDARTDIFSLGALLYEAITGRHPFERRNRASVVAAILTSDPPPLSSVQPSVPSTLERVVERCLAKDPEQRWQTARDLAAELRWIAQEGSQAERRVMAPRRAMAETTKQVWPPAAAESPDAIAILPFRPLVAKAADEMLELGIADALITAVASTGEIVVRSLAAAQRSAARRDDPVAVGRELAVASVLDGSIQREGDRVRVTARLLRVADGLSLWAGGFTEEVTGLLTVQVAIAERIAAAVVPWLGGAARGRLVKRHTERPDAYWAYLAGRYNMLKGTQEGLEKAMAFFKQAVALDPRYALAWVGLSDAYTALDWYGVTSTRQSNPQAKAAAETALAIDDGLAEAHAALAIARVGEWDWAGAERAYQRALELNPNCAGAHQLYALCLNALRRTDEALLEMRRAEELDPTSLAIGAEVALILQCAHRYDESVQQCLRVLEVEPACEEARFYLALTHVLQGRVAEGIAEHGRLTGRNPDFLALLGHAHAVAGDRAKAEEIRARLLALSADRYSPSFWVAFVELGLGRHEEAIRWLEKAREDPDDSFTLVVNASPFFDPLRSHPRFQQLLQRMGLPAQ